MKQYIVDAFTDQPFSGNPAAVCMMEQWPCEESMKRLARENNLSDTVRGEELDIHAFSKIADSIYKLKKNGA